MRWVEFKSKKPPKNLPFLAKGQEGCGWRFLCTPFGKEMHITDCEQCQYVFGQEDEIEVKGHKLVYWLDEDMEEDDDGFYLPPWEITEENEEKTEAFILGQKTMIQEGYEKV